MENRGESLALQRGEDVNLQIHAENKRVISVM